MCEIVCEQIQFLRNKSQRPISFRKKRKAIGITTYNIQAIEYKDLLQRRSKRAPSNNALYLQFKIEINKVWSVIRASKWRYFWGQLDKAANTPTNIGPSSTDAVGKIHMQDLSCSTLHMIPSQFRMHSTIIIASTSLITAGNSHGFGSLKNSLCKLFKRCRLTLAIWRAWHTHVTLT